MNSNNGNSRDEEYTSSSNMNPNKKTVVSDALAKNSRQLLYAHLYNYLVENKLYDTARILLKEADVPLSTPLEKEGNDGDSNEYGEGDGHENGIGMNDINLDDGSSLPGVKMLMTSPDTFLLEWWQSLWALHSYVKETPAIHQQQQQLLSNSFNPCIPPQQQQNGINIPNGPTSQQFMQPKSNNSPIMDSQRQTNQNSMSNSPANHQQVPHPAATQAQAAQQLSQSNHNGDNGPTSQQSLQSPLPQSANDTPHATNLTAPSPSGSATSGVAPDSNMIQMQNIPPQGQQGQSNDEHITPQMHQRTPVVQHQQQPGGPQGPGQGPGQGQGQQGPPQSLQQRQPQHQWQFNKMQQQLQAQELQQRVQLQKMQLNNQFNFQNLPPQQQQQFFLQQQQRLQAAQIAAQQTQQQQQQAQGGIQQRPQQGPQPPVQTQFPQYQQGPIPQQASMGSNFGTPIMQNQQRSKDQNSNNSGGSSVGDSNGLRGENSSALQDYQVHLMMLETQTKQPGQPVTGQQPTGPVINPQISQLQHTLGSEGKTRVESIGVDPLQRDPNIIMNSNFMDLFNPNELNSAQWQNQHPGQPGGPRGSQSGNSGAGNPIDELNVDLGVGFPNAGGFMNGF